MKEVKDGEGALPKEESKHITEGGEGEVTEEYQRKEMKNTREAKNIGEEKRREVKNREQKDRVGKGDNRGVGKGAG
jgi:hypothetical protein